MGTGFARKKKEEKSLRQNLLHLQQTVAQQMASLEVEGSAGNGLVSIVLTGNGEMKSIAIQPTCIDPEDKEGLEALVRAAYNQAFAKLQKFASASGDISSLLN